VTGLVQDLAAAAEKEGLPHGDEGTPVGWVRSPPAYRPSISWTRVRAAAPPASRGVPVLPEACTPWEAPDDHVNVVTRGGRR